MRAQCVQESRDRDADGGGYLAPICSLSPPSPALSVVPLLLAAAAASPFSSSSVFTLFDWGWFCTSPFCLLVGRDAEAEAWAARRWRGFATAGGEKTALIKKEKYYCMEYEECQYHQLQNILGPPINVTPNVTTRQSELLLLLCGFDFLDVFT